jgi:hypothetical protein
MAEPTVCPIHLVDTALWEHSLPVEDHTACFKWVEISATEVPEVSV